MEPARNGNAHTGKAQFMKGISFQRRPQNRVTALFEAGVFSIDISGATTFGDLATRLADLGNQHGETLTAVQLRPASRLTHASRVIGPDAATTPDGAVFSA
jgi:hypothetical protein